MSRLVAALAALALVAMTGGVFGAAALLEVNAGTIQVFRLPVSIGPIAAAIDIDPDSLNPKSQGNYVTAYIELPEGFAVAGIDIETVTLRVEGNGGSVNAESAPTEVGDHDGDGVADRMVKFGRQAVLDLVGAKTGDVTFVVAGQLADGAMFQGSDTVDP